MGFTKSDKVLDIPVIYMDQLKMIDNMNNIEAHSTDNFKLPNLKMQATQAQPMF